MLTVSASKVELRLHASLLKWKSAPVVTHELHGECTVSRCLAENGIPERDVAIIIVNGKRGKLDTLLQAGDRLSLFPLIGGG